MGGGESTDVDDRRRYVGSLTHFARPVSLNASYGHHRYERTEHVIEWRDAFWVLAKQARMPRLDAIHIVVECGMSGRLQDIGNCYPSVKAAIDGLVQAGVIPDDTGDHLLSLNYLPPVRIPPRQPDYLTLRVTEEGANDWQLIAQALRSAIAAHGPITPEWIGSAAKRIKGVLAA